MLSCGALELGLLARENQLLNFQEFHEPVIKHNYYKNYIFNLVNYILKDNKYSKLII